MPLLTFLSDFGSASPYPAAMKVAAAVIAPQAVLVDISHDVPPGAIRQGAYLLWAVAPTCPPGTVHCAVVDPGVGTDRAPLAVAAGGQVFVGPDNGVLLPAARHVGTPAVYRLTNPAYWRPVVSPTFHGRDVFAPAAAHLAVGAPLADLGEPFAGCIEPAWPTGGWEGAALLGEVLWIDAFGNVITNIPGALLAEIPPSTAVAVKTPLRTVPATIARTFGDVAAGEAAVLAGSDGMVEVAVNRGRASTRLRATVGTRIRIRRR
ncbi:MAG TPA: SAM-dependent chlorinase/fluorinase [bacterium]|nr:SAM-dependent chlorinase/fluorinase [bacterium]